MRVWDSCGGAGWCNRFRTAVVCNALEPEGTLRARGVDRACRAALCSYVQEKGLGLVDKSRRDVDCCIGTVPV